VRIILLSEKEDIVNEFRKRIETIPFLSIEAALNSPKEVIQYKKDHDVDLLVMSTENETFDSLEFGKRIRQEDGHLILFYISEQNQKALEAVKLHAAVLLKPYKAEDVLYAFEMAYLLYKRKPKRIYARTFGYFDLFLDGRPLVFKSGKAKELLALLIDRRGGTVDTDQIIAALWNDRPRDESTQSLCSKLCKTLQKELKNYGIEELLISSRNSRYIDTDLLDCDLYDLQDGKEEAKKLYYGEYMTDYAWAEYRNYSLSKYM